MLPDTIKFFVASAEYALPKYKFPAMPTNIENNTIKELAYELSQNYPNSFNPATDISYIIAKKSFVTLKFIIH